LPQGASDVVTPLDFNSRSALCSPSAVAELMSCGCVSVEKIRSQCTPCLKKTVQICFCQNFIKFLPILIIFGRKMAKGLKLCEVHSFSTSPNSRHHTAMLNAGVPNCYTTLKVVICNKLSNNLISTQ